MEMCGYWAQSTTLFPSMMTGDLFIVFFILLFPFFSLLKLKQRQNFQTKKSIGK